MKEEKIAKAYARSLVELAEAKKIDVAAELTSFNDIIRQNNNLETVMFLDVFTADEKKSVVNAVIEKMHLSALLKHFVDYLLDEKRLGLFPLIFKEVIVMDDYKKGFMRGTIEGSEEDLSPEMLSKLTKQLEKELHHRAQLEYRKSESVSAGYRITVGDLQLDASLDHQLNILKNSIINS